MMLSQILLTIDGPIFFFFQHLQSPGLNYLFAWPTRFGELQIAAGLVICFLLVFDFKNCLKKIPPAVLGLVFATWTADLVKNLFARPRPFLFWSGVNVIFSPPLNFSFPSGHTATAFAAAYFLDQYCFKQNRWVYLAALWVGITRIYIGVHYPTDILGGIVVGIGSAAIIHKSFEKLYQTA